MWYFEAHMTLLIARAIEIKYVDTMYSDSKKIFRVSENRFALTSKFMDCRPSA